MELYKKRIKDLFKSHLFISFVGIIFGSLISVIFFILISKYLNEIYLAKFSLGLLFFFGIVQLSLIGLEQNIIANSNSINPKILFFDKKIILILLAIFISIILCVILFLFKDIFIIPILFQDIVILNIAIIVAVINRTIQAYIQSCSRLYENAIINFLRYFGYLIFLIVWLFDNSINILTFFLIGELVALFSIFVIILFKIPTEYKSKKITYNLNYSFLGLSQFSYESLFKLDLLTISILGTQQMLITYTILSNVIEGMVNFLSVAHPSVNNYMSKFKFNNITNKDKKLMTYIDKFSIFSLLAIFPCYFIFHYAVFDTIPELLFMLMAFLFSMCLIYFRKLFLFFNYFAINNLPFYQFMYGIFLITTNMILNFVLFEIMNILGILLATFITYVIAYFFIKKNIKKYY